ncbi:MAG: HalX domain-containing protein, partial [Halobacteria archaeon]|nr:HalX domain-containing protein [Halobacteria archaeon]
DVDVVFLDRRMPGMSGDEVLDGIRDRGYDCKVAMVTAVDPDFDIIDMGFDDYVVKPVTRDDLYDKVDQLLSRNDYQGKVQRYFALASKRATLQSEKTEEELKESEEYAELQEELEELREEADDLLEDLSEEDDFSSLYHDL